jgi:hypothetical protein
MRLAFSAAAPGRVRVYPPHSASLVCALAFLAAVAGQVNFDYQVTLGPTIDPNSIGSGVGTVAGGFTRPGGTPAGLHNSKLFVADTGRHVIKGIDRGSGGVETVAGKEDESGLVDGVRNEARFYNPHGVAVSADGNRAPPHPHAACARAPTFPAPVTRPPPRSPPWQCSSPTR